MDKELIEKMRDLIRRGQTMVDSEYYLTWHEDARELLAALEAKTTDAPDKDRAEALERQHPIAAMSDDEIMAFSMTVEADVAPTYKEYRGNGYIVSEAWVIAFAREVGRIAALRAPAAAPRDDVLALRQAVVDLANEVNRLHRYQANHETTALMSKHAATIAQCREVV